MATQVCVSTWVGYEQNNDAQEQSISGSEARFLADISLPEMAIINRLLFNARRHLLALFRCRAL